MFPLTRIFGVPSVLFMFPDDVIEPGTTIGPPNQAVPGAWLAMNRVLPPVIMYVPLALLSLNSPAFMSIEGPLIHEFMFICVDAPYAPLMSPWNCVVPVNVALLSVLFMRGPVSDCVTMVSVTLGSVRVFRPPVAVVIRRTVPVLCPEKARPFPCAREASPVGLMVKAGVPFVSSIKLLKLLVPIIIVPVKELPPFITTSVPITPEGPVWP